MRVVADTNILISGLLWHGLPASFLDQALNRRFHLFGSKEILAELEDVLRRPKFAALLRTRGIGPVQVAAKYRGIVRLVEPVDIAPPPRLRDLKDIPILRCAVAAGAHAIVSGDRHLLDLTTFNDIPIVTPREFLAAMGS